MNLNLAESLVNDRMFTTKLGLSQSLTVQEGTHNLNATLIGYPKKFWGLFGQKAHKTQQITLFHRGGLSLTLASQGQTYIPKCKPKRLPNEILSFCWDGSAHNTHNTANVSDWLIFQNQAISLIMMLMLISHSLYDFSQQAFHHRQSSDIYIYISHISHFVGESSSIQY